MQASVQMVSWCKNGRAYTGEVSHEEGVGIRTHLLHTQGAVEAREASDIQRKELDAP